MSTNQSEINYVLSLDTMKTLHKFREDSDKVLKSMLKDFHPDVNKDPKSEEVFNHIQVIRNSLRNKELKINNNKMYSVRETYIGNLYAGIDTLGWSFAKDPNMMHLFDSNLSSLRFQNDKMKQQMQPLLPIDREVDKDSQTILFRDNKEELKTSLSDILDKHGSIDPKHAAWIGSNLMNIACYAEWLGWVFPNIDVENIILLPNTHVTYLLGGWEQAVPFGKKPSVASRRTLRLDPGLRISGLFHNSFTLTAVRQTICEILGDPTGMVLKGVPEPIVKWLKSPALSARKDYANWYWAIEKSFGPRKFLKWPY